jgi:hypothetical protein
MRLPKRWAGTRVTCSVAKPHPSYRRLSRYDCTGLVWLGHSVIALTEVTATIRNSHTGAITTYRRFNKPALGPAER